MNNRSSSYQHLFYEVQSEDMDIYSSQDQVPYSEKFIDLNDQASSLIFELAQNVLTKRQLNIWNMTLVGYSVKQIATTLKCTPDAITKSLGGDYTDAGVRYGGIYEKLRKAIIKSKELKAIIRQMHIEMDIND